MEEHVFRHNFRKWDKVFGVGKNLPQRTEFTGQATAARERHSGLVGLCRWTVARMIAQMSRMRILVLSAACLAGVLPSPARGLPAARLQEALDSRSSRVNYEIEAKVDGQAKVLEGKETISFHNRTPVATSELWFHLYLNAFSNNRSTHLTEGKGRVRGNRKLEEGWGWQRIESLQVGGAELADQVEFVSPDDGLESDRTVVRVPLPAPVEPGETVEIQLEWTSQLPRVRRRTGYKDRFMLIAQWFPKLGVFEGEDGWNCHQFHLNSEFYSNFGTYDVTLDLPEEYAGKVGASGVQAGEPAIANGRVRTRFLAPSLADRDRSDWTGRPVLVHDFTWTADPDYVVHEDIFRYADWAERFPEEVAEVEAALPGRDVTLRDVNVRVFIHPEREGQWQRHFEATCTALFFYGLWFGEYPYEQITAVDPAWGARAAGGMEYPTLFTCGTQMFTSPAMYRPESVTVHEAGHQFWYGLVANNEFENAWLDEGFNSYTDSEALVRRYGLQRSATWYSRLPVWGTRMAQGPGGRDWADWITLQGMPFGSFEAQPLGTSGLLQWWKEQPLLTLADELTDPRWSDRSRYLGNAEWDPVETPAWQYVDRSSYSANSYPRPAVILRTLSGLVGRDAFLKGMRSYTGDWRFRHPYPDDFFEAFSRGAGVDVGWYFEDMFRGTGTLDWSVQVSQRRLDEDRGYFEGPDTELVLRDPDEGDDEGDEPEEEADEDADDSASEEGGKLRSYDVVLRRKGTLRLPVDVLVKFDDDSEETLTWTRAAQADSKWWRLPLDNSSKKITAVIVDPERKIYVDTDMSNNQWYAVSDETAPWRWSERVLVQYQHLLHWFANTGG